MSKIVSVKSKKSINGRDQFKKIHENFCTNAADIVNQENIPNDIIIEEQDLIDESNIDDINNSDYDNYKLPSSNLLNEPIEITNELNEDDLKKSSFTINTCA